MSAVRTTIEGKRIQRAAAREFWLEGELSCSCCPILLEDEDLRCWRIYYDDEHCLWRVDHGGMPFPAIGSVIGDTEMQWKDVELIGANRILGHRVVSADEFGTDHQAQMSLDFDNAERLALSHSFADDRGSYDVSVRG